MTTLRVVSFKADPPFRARLNAGCQREGLSQSALIRAAVDRFLAPKPRKPKRRK